MNVPSKNKFLYFMEQTDGAFDAEHDMACYPASNLVGFSNPASTTRLELYFIPLEDGGTTDHDKVTLTITENKQKEVIEAILNEIAFGNSSFVVIADNANSSFLSVQPNAATPIAISNVLISVTAAA